MKDPEKVKQGKRNRRAGAMFELKVRRYLESKDWIVDKWTNQVEDGKLRPAKSNRFNMRTCGFPDFVIFNYWGYNLYTVWGVEVKSKGILSKEEKEKCVFYLENNIFEKIFIAKKSNSELGIEFNQVGLKDEFKKKE